MKVPDDFLLLLAVFAVWAALALAYALAPMFDMPGAALVWGVGAVVFLALALAEALAAWRGRRRSVTSP